MSGFVCFCSLANHRILPLQAFIRCPTKRPPNSVSCSSVSWNKPLSSQSSFSQVFYSCSKAKMINRCLGIICEIKTKTLTVNSAPGACNWIDLTVFNNASRQETGPYQLEEHEQRPASREKSQGIPEAMGRCGVPGEEWLRWWEDTHLGRGSGILLAELSCRDCHGFRTKSLKCLGHCS